MRVIFKILDRRELELKKKFSTGFPLRKHKILPYSSRSLSTMEVSVSKKMRNAAAISVLSDDLLVDILILSHVPVKSLCRCKCVSPSWRDLISHPAHSKKLPQTLLGFFYFPEFDPCEFVGLVGPSKRQPRPPSLVDFSFLPVNGHGRGHVLDCCNGLVLLQIGSRSYLVYNPATKMWTAVPPPEPPQTGQECTDVRLCFDPAVSPHFHLVRLMYAKGDGGWDGEWDEPVDLFAGYEIYSSDTGHWVPLPDDGPCCQWAETRTKSRTIPYLL